MMSPNRLRTLNAEIAELAESLLPANARKKRERKNSLVFAPFRVFSRALFRLSSAISAGSALKINKPPEDRTPNLLLR
jgi:hypothetical protein